MKKRSIYARLLWGVTLHCAHCRLHTNRVPKKTFLRESSAGLVGKHTNWKSWKILIRSTRRVHFFHNEPCQTPEKQKHLSSRLYRLLKLRTLCYITKGDFTSSHIGFVALIKVLKLSGAMLSVMFRFTLYYRGWLYLHTHQIVGHFIQIDISIFKFVSISPNFTHIFNDDWWQVMHSVQNLKNKIMIIINIYTTLKNVYLK